LCSAFTDTGIKVKQVQSKRLKKEGPAVEKKFNLQLQATTGGELRMNPMRGKRGK